MKKKVILLLISIFTVCIIAVSPMIGMDTIPFSAFFNPIDDNVKSIILWEIRLPRVIMAFIAGAALSLSGMTFQALFRNPLATPFTLGVSSGAAFGAALYVKLGLFFSFLSIPGQPVFAFIGALVSVFIVYSLTRFKKSFSTATLLLAGVAVSFFFSSLILVIQYLSDFTHSFRIIRWLMGGVEIVGFESVYNILPFVTAGIAIIFFLNNELNLLTFGEDIAFSRGVNVQRVKILLYFAASLMVGSVVATCGPIGFVGMMCPHICRLFIGQDHRYLASASLLFGGGFLVMCDAVSRTVIAPAEIPVGIITALLGGPFFLWLLINGKSEQSIMNSG